MANKGTISPTSASSDLNRRTSLSLLDRPRHDVQGPVERSRAAAHDRPADFEGARIAVNGRNRHAAHQSADANLPPSALHLKLQPGTWNHSRRTVRRCQGMPGAGT